MNLIRNEKHGWLRLDAQSNMKSFLPAEIREIIDFDGSLTYQSQFLDKSIESIIENIIWRNDPITMFGKTYPQPRLTAWYGDEGVEYSYSKIKMKASQWTPELYLIKSKLESEINTTFNSVLINFYRDGLDHMSYHSDDELELGINPTIASLSFGETRFFHLKHKFKLDLDVIKLPIEHGSLIVMKDELQHFWQHKISKTTKKIGSRLNLTFRKIY